MNVLILTRDNITDRNEIVYCNISELKILPFDEKDFNYCIVYRPYNDDKDMVNENDIVVFRPDLYYKLKMFDADGYIHLCNDVIKNLYTCASDIIEQNPHNLIMNFNVPDTIKNLSNVDILK